VTRTLYSVHVNNTNPPNTLESLQPLSGHYSCKKDLKLNAWLAVATAIYLLDRVLSVRHPDWSVAARAALAVAPLVPGLLYIRSWMRFISGLDELQRGIQLEAWLFAVMGTVLIGTAVSALNQSGVHLGGLGQGLGVGSAFMLTFFFWFVGSALAGRRFK
jgi:hypothetical protein